MTDIKAPIRQNLRQNIKGASILEAAVTMLTIAIMVAGVGTALYSTTLAARDRSALNQLEALKTAIVGQHGSDSGSKAEGRNGYIGDIGALPASLASLEVAGALPDYAVEAALQLGAGWRGPYVSSSISSTTDPWGYALVYSTASGVSTVTGAATVATIRSIGADGVNGTSDDHLVEIYKSEAFTTLTGYVTDRYGSTMSGVTVRMSYPANGVITSATATTDSNGLYTFNDIPRGTRVIELTPQLSYLKGSGLTSGNNRNNLEFVIENLAKDAASVTSVKLSWTTTPASNFKRLLIVGVQLFSGTVDSDTTLTISPAKSFAGADVMQEPFHIQVSGLYMIVPNAVIATVGNGGSFTFEFEDFEESGNNTDVDVTGVNFTVEFSDGSKTVFSPLRK
jgi:hypothetical protein